MYYFNSKWYIFGIVSFVESLSNGNCYFTKPSYYTQVAAYLDWIEYPISTCSKPQWSPITLSLMILIGYLLKT